MVVGRVVSSENRSTQTDEEVIYERISEASNLSQHFDQMMNDFRSTVTAWSKIRTIIDDKLENTEKLIADPRRDSKQHLTMNFKIREKDRDQGNAIFDDRIVTLSPQAKVSYYDGFVGYDIELTTNSDANHEGVKMNFEKHD